jgi:hypothetical protein
MEYEGLHCEIYVYRNFLYGKHLLTSFPQVPFISLRGLIEGTVNAKVLSSRNRRENEDGIGESQPFRERTLSVPDKQVDLTVSFSCLEGYTLHYGVAYFFPIFDRI